MSSRTISPSIPSALRMRTRTLRRDPKGRVSISVGDLGCHRAVGTDGQLRLGCAAPRGAAGGRPEGLAVLSMLVGPFHTSLRVRGGLFSRWTTTV